MRTVGDIPGRGEPRRLLNAHGLRATPVAVRVLSLLQVAVTPLTHEEIADAIRRDSGRAPDKVTLYRVLERLSGVGLCHRITASDRISRYTGQTDHAAHVFECARCHRLLPLPAVPELPAALERIDRALRRKGIRTDGAVVTLKGTCADCGD